MDDVDAVQAQISRNMLASGDWVTARLDGIVYLEKAPLIYWLMAICFKVLGPYDWVARIPVVLSAIAAALLTAGFGFWAFGKRAGYYAGLCMATCIGLFLFTRILIPDVMVTAGMTLSMWAFLRAIDEEEPRPGWWAFLLAASLGVSLLLKSTIGVVFPMAAVVIYLGLTRQLFVLNVWKRLRPFSGILVILGDCRALACSSGAAQSALFRSDPSQRTRRVPRVPLVLLYERAGAAISELALSARLQHRSARVLLVVPSDLAVSLERLLSGHRQALVSAAGPRRPRARLLCLAGPASSWSSFRFPPRRSIIQCRVTPRWRC